jgi:SAM-dependent methyltransferase
MSLRRFVQQVRFFGFSRECPFCRSRLRTFLPFGADLPIIQQAQVVGGGRRAEALCPVCFSSDRERLVYLYLENRRMFSDKTTCLLHVAPERNLRSVLAGRAGVRYVTGDLCFSGVAVGFDLSHLPFACKTFDAVICCHVLEHVTSDSTAMSEIRRVLKPGGWAVLQVPIAQACERTIEDPTLVDPAERERLFGQNDHVRLYGRDYSDRLRRAGFEVEVIPFCQQLGAGLTHRYGLDEREDIYVGIRTG